ncbi:flagellar hook-basal body complex protein FliE [Nesterenkonia populi]|uniref:flagellar hook-basal body complex protein FliE n=1 Tax=Nesterenkonia populi TaxID=1591087 RepID=UPI0011BE1ACB|nr:flagellar hook-basal body complex protein FliE [Nesterenkonia populi]
MTEAIFSAAPTTATGYVQQQPQLESAGALAGASAAEGAGSSFASMLGGAVDDISGMESSARQLSVDGVSGNLDDLHQATLAQQRASLAFETISAFRNRGVEAFNEIMRMQA